MKVRRPVVAAIAFAASTAALVPVAYIAMFTGFRTYDDEGYFLLTLRDYLSGHPLMSQYTPLYGPFFYEVMGGVFRVLGLEPGHDNGRFVTLIVWLLASVLGGLSTFRLTRNLWLGVAAEFVTFTVLRALAYEPMSTYGLVSLLLLGLAMTSAYRSERPRFSAALIGGFVGALCLVKVNVGVFAGLAVGFAWACTLPDRARRLILPLAGLLLVTAPFALVAAMLNRAWAMEFAMLVALSAAAVTVVCIMTATHRPPPPSIGWLAVGGVVIVVACLAIALLGGASPGDAWTLLWVSFHFPGVFTFPVTSGIGFDIWALVSAASAVAFVFGLARDRVPHLVPLLRIAAGLFTWLLLLVLPETIFLLALPVVWLAAIGPRQIGDDPTGTYARLLLPALAVMESLQIYPVAGTQLWLGALMLVPVGAIGLNDGIRELRALIGTRPGRVQPVTWVAPMALAASVAVFVQFAILAAVWFNAETPLGVPGAESTRLPAQQVAQLRALVAAIDRNCSSFMTYPGLDSFYIWTAQEPPTPLRYELWWLTIDVGSERSIVQALERRPRLCVVKSQLQLDFWLEGRQLPDRPLVDFFNQDFVNGGSFGDYQLLVRS